MECQWIIFVAGEKGVIGELELGEKWPIFGWKNSSWNGFGKIKGQVESWSKRRQSNCHQMMNSKRAKGGFRDSSKEINLENSMGI